MARKKWFEATTTKEEMDWYHTQFHTLFKKDNTEPGLFAFANEVQTKGTHKAFIEPILERVTSEIKDPNRSHDYRVRLAGGLALYYLNVKYVILHYCTFEFVTGILLNYFELLSGQCGARLFTRRYIETYTMFLTQRFVIGFNEFDLHLEMT